MNTRAILLALAASLACTAPQAAAYEQLPYGLARLSPVDFAGAVNISKQPDSITVLSTQDGYTRSRAAQGARAEDVHFRAVIDGRSGKVSWQVWHRLVHAWRYMDIRAVRYELGGATRTIAPKLVEHGTDRCPPTDGVGSCNTAVDVMFELPEEAIREMASNHRGNARNAWPLQFITADGTEIGSGLAPAEAAGLIHAYESWQRRPS